MTTVVKSYRIGEKKVMRNEMIAEIISYRRNNDIDVKYEDGLIVKHIRYNNFVQGGLKRDDKKPIIWRYLSPRKNYIGRKRRTLNGYRTLLAINDDSTIDYIDDDGTLVKQGSYSTFLNTNRSLYHIKTRKGVIVEVVE